MDVTYVTLDPDTSKQLLPVWINFLREEPSLIEHVEYAKIHKRFKIDQEKLRKLGYHPTDEDPHNMTRR